MSFAGFKYYVEFTANNALVAQDFANFVQYLDLGSFLTAYGSNVKDDGEHPQRPL